VEPKFFRRTKRGGSSIPKFPFYFLPRIVHLKRHFRACFRRFMFFSALCLGSHRVSGSDPVSSLLRLPWDFLNLRRFSEDLPFWYSYLRDIPYRSFLPPTRKFFSLPFSLSFVPSFGPRTQLVRSLSPSFPLFPSTRSYFSTGPF